MASESEQLNASSDSFDPLASIYSSEESVPDPSAPMYASKMAPPLTWGA